MARYDVRVMRWGDGSQVPTSGKGLFILGIDNEGLLNIRAYDERGKTLLNSEETKIIYKDGSQPLPRFMVEAIATLKRKVEGLQPPYELTPAQKDELETLTHFLWETMWIPYFGRYVSFGELRKIQSDTSFQGLNVRSLETSARSELASNTRRIEFCKRTIAVGALVSVLFVFASTASGWAILPALAAIGLTAMALYGLQDARKCVERAKRDQARLPELKARLAALPPEEPPPAPSPEPSPEPPPRQRPGAPPGDAPKAPYKTTTAYRYGPNGSERVEVDENGRIINP